MDVGDEGEQRRGLHCFGEAELVRCLERIAEVAASVGQGHDLRPRSLRLQQVGREVRGRQRCPDRADDLPAAGVHDVGRRLLELGAECVVRGDEEPGLAALVEDRPGRAVGERGRIVAVVDHVGVAVLPGQRGARRADREEGNLPLLGDRRQGQADPGVGAAEQHREALCVGPFAKLARADVGLVLVVGCQEFDRLAERAAAKIGDRHLDPLDRPRAVHVRIDPGQIVDVADDDLVGRPRRERRKRDDEPRRGRRKPFRQCHSSFLLSGRSRSLPYPGGRPSH